MIKHKPVSLFVRTSLMLVGGVVMTFLVYWGLHALSSWGINTFYMAPDAVEARNRALHQELRSYVSSVHMSSTDYELAEAWAGENDADLIIYEDDRVMEAGGWGHEVLEENSADTQALDAWGYTTFSVDFANGNRQVAIADCSDLTLQSTMQDVIVLVTFFVFVATILFYTRRISRYLQAFSRDVTAVSGGESEHVDENRGFSELGALARDVNHMHDVITERTRSAQEALQANRELITALSHDIRNPLTSLIGYLDLLGMDTENLSDAQRQYLAVGMEKADRIRELTDEIFRYFLIFSDAETPVHTERFDAQILLEQLLGEYAIELRAQDYTVECDTLQQPCEIDTDIQLLHRVLDNLFSNIRKYADPNQPVVLQAQAEGKMLAVRLSNVICDPPPHNVESNRVGLRTCAAILKLLGGTFRAGREDRCFVAEFTLPIVPKTE